MPLNWRNVTEHLISNAKSMRRPISASFELTSRCNLRCKMCYIAGQADNKELKGRELSTAQWIRLAEMAKDAGVLFVTLTGGEVFLRKDFGEIYEALASMGFIIQIYTNATLITPEIAKWLGKIPPLQVSCTVYGASADTYEKICGNRDGYEKAINAIRYLRQEGINLEVKTTAVRDNWREFNEIGKIAREFGAVFGVVNYILPRREGCGSDPEGQRMTPEEFIDFDEIVMEYNKTVVGSFAKITNDEYENSLVPVIEDTDKDDEDAFYCQAGKSGLWLTWDGRMTPCGLMSEPAVYPLKVGMEQAWEELKNACRQIPVCRECEECDMKSRCYHCPARLKLETGQYDKPAPYLCEIAKLRKYRDQRLE